MLLFAFPEHASLARSLTLPRGDFTIHHFANQERQIRLNSKVRGQDTVILGRVGPTGENLAAFLLLAHTLAKERAKKITALLPYLDYARQDQDEPGRSLAAAAIGKMLLAVGVDEVITVEVHSPAVAGMFPVPLTSISAEEVFVDLISQELPANFTLVSPDEGGLDRCQRLAKRLGLADVTFISKERTDEGVQHGKISGPVGKRAVIADDILDTGETLVSCAGKLLAAGAEEITIMVAHGLFTGTAWQKLWQLPISQIYCLDTVPQTKKDKVTVIPVAPLITKYLHE